MIWFTSDLHWLHGHNGNRKGIIDYCNRPFQDIHEMNETLIKNWNDCVKSTDTIYVLGDMSLGPYKDFVPIAKRLNGTKYLIKGNHDGYTDGQYAKIGFTVFHEIKMKIAGQTVRMSHYPYALPWRKRLFAFKSELRFMDRRPMRIKGEFLLHGHTHTKKKMIGNMIHVGVDANDFRPVSLGKIESLMARAKK